MADNENFITVGDLKKILEDQDDNMFVVFGIDEDDEITTYSIQSVSMSSGFITFWSIG